MTVYSGGNFVRQEEGCKVALVRPNLLVAATGEEDSVYNQDHWNALEQAKQAIKTLPENPTSQQLEGRGKQWAQTLWTHYRQSGMVPGYVGVVSQLVVMTKIDGHVNVVKPTVSWNGSRFEAGSFASSVLPTALTQYSGLCEKFVTTHDESGAHPREIQITADELSVLDAIGRDRSKAQTMDQLSDVAMRNELEFTAIDERFEGSHTVIAGPYATAEWDYASDSWKTDFNSKCLASSAPNTKQEESIPASRPLPFQFCILIIAQIDVFAAPAPCANAALKLWHVLRVAAHNEGPQTVQCGEAIISGLWAYQGSAILLHEINPP
jgi:hypothetical protein